eukprot:1850997-Pleurochrysis_carterae.AAC.1
MPVRRRRLGGRRGEDTLCTYDAVRTVWEERESAVPASERTHGRRSDTPFFTAKDGVTPWTTKQSRALAKQMAAALGFDATEFGG